MSETTLAQALLAFQADPPPVHLDATNPHFKSKYASLAGVVAAVRPELVKHGLVISQQPSVLDGQPALTTRLIHAASGESQESTMLLVLEKPTPQSLGSALTYARRQSLLAVLNLVGDEDDDAEKAERRAGSSFQAPDTKPDNGSEVGPTDKQRKLIYALLHKLNYGEAEVLRVYGKKVADLARPDASDLIERLKAKEALLMHVEPGEQPEDADLVEAGIPFMWIDGFGSPAGVHVDPWRRG